MPRGRLTDPRKAADREALRAFMEGDMTQARIGKRGEILEVKHSLFGWMDPQQYTLLREAKGLLPEFIRAGYQLKASLWSLEAGIATVNIPLGAYIPIKGITLAASAQAAGNTQAAVKWLAATFLPFGDVLILIQIWNELAAIAEDGIWNPVSGFLPLQAVVGSTGVGGALTGWFFSWLLRGAPVEPGS